MATTAHPSSLAPAPSGPGRAGSADRRPAASEADEGSLEQSQAARQLSDERLATVLENSLDVIYRRDLMADRYDCVSASVETVTGYTPDEFMRGGLESTVGRIHPDDLEPVRAAIAKVMASPAGRGSAEYRYRRKDGVYRWFADHFRVTRDTGGAPRYWVGAVRDVTELKDAVALLQRSRDELESEVHRRTAQLKAMTVRLIGAEERERERIGHVLHEDLQQVLVGLRFMLQAGPKAASPEEHAAASIAVVDEALRVARSLSSELLPAALMEEDLAAGLAEMVADLRQRVGLDVSIEAGDGATTESHDIRVFILRAVRELLLNVAKHAATQRAEVRLCAIAGDRVGLEVRDRGVGFEPAMVRPGGVGLFRLRERTEALGGSLRIASSHDTGTCVTIELPRR